MHASDPHSHILNLARPQNVPEATLFLRNTKQYNHLSYISIKTAPLVQPYTYAGDCKGVGKISGSHFCESLFSSSVAFLKMSVASQKRRPFNAGKNKLQRGE
jgi:hypothetical protein